MRFSDTLLNTILGTGLVTAFSAPDLQVREGVPPDSPHDAVQGNLLCTVALPPTGYFAAASGSVVALAGSWNGIVDSTGTAGWFRLANSADTGAASTSLPRIDGVIDDDMGDIWLSSLSLVINDTLVVQQFSVSMAQAFINARASGTFA